MNQALEGLDGIGICADDVIVYYCSEDDEVAKPAHDDKLMKLMGQCNEKNLKLNREKKKSSSN